MVRLHRGCKQRYCCLSGESRGGGQSELIKKLRQEEVARRKATIVKLVRAFTVKRKTWRLPFSGAGFRDQPQYSGTKSSVYLRCAMHLVYLDFVFVIADCVYTQAPRWDAA